MDSPQSVVSPFKNLTVSGSEPEKQMPEIHLSNGSDNKAVSIHNPEDFIGVLDVYIHQARDIHNICIYHKQDVYAKLCLTSDPESGVSTQIINGGGRNPVFNENLRLNVRTIESSLKCEVWMLSRVRNYLQDQLLGFALVPLSEVLIKSGKIEREFSLSSTELFHSPAGFVQLSVSYSGTCPDVIAIPKSMMETETRDSVPEDFENIEFPDPKIVNENQMMVSEYFGLACTDNNNNNNSLDSQTTESSDTESHELGVRVVESFSANSEDSKAIPNVDSPPSSVSTNGSPSICLPATSQSSETPIIPKSPRDEHVSPMKDKHKDATEGESESSNGHEPSKETFAKPVFTVNIEPEEKMVQQDIVDMYMKSMQQFTESLAKMKLPMDLKSEPSKSEDSSSDQKLPTPKSTGSRVFYGSRAFF